MRYYATNDRRKSKEARDKLTSLDKAILSKCSGGEGVNVIRVLKAGKPFINDRGRKQFATTDDILASVRKLQRFGLLVGR